MDRKPSRLRAACNACHASKLRCSGEKAGCKRCIANGLQCEYQVSMVGRAPSKNKRQRLNPPASSPASSADTAPRRPTSRSQEILSPPPSSVENDASTQLLHPTPSDSGVTTSTPLPHTPLDSVYQLPQDCDHDWLFSKSRDSNGADALSDFMSMELPSDFDFNMSDLDGTMADLQSLSDLAPPAKERLTHSPATHGDHCPISMLQPPPERQNCQDPNHGKYRHVLHMVKVVASLETKSAQEQVDLDDILQFNKACLRTINMIFEAEGRKFCMTCKALAPTALNMVLSLYEKAISQSRGSADETAKPATLQLGCFELEADDQAMLRDIVIRRELRRTIQMMQTLSECSRCPGMGKECGMVIWYTHIERRLQSLMPAMEQTE